jgi:hypothetical protein
MLGQQKNIKLQVVVGKKDKMKLREFDHDKEKFRSVHTKSSFDSTFGGFYTNHVPLSTKFMQIYWVKNE